MSNIRQCARCNQRYLAQHGHTCPSEQECASVVSLVAKPIPNPNIMVLYTCDKCGLKDAEVELKSRFQESLETWMHQMGLAVSRDHKRRSPGCNIKKFTSVKIPVGAADRVGGPSVQ